MNQESNRGDKKGEGDHTHRRAERGRRKRGRRELGGGGGGGGDEASTESVVLNWEDNAISVSLGVSAEDLTVNRV